MRTRTRVAALAAATSMLAAACGGARLDVESDPAGAVAEAFRNMGDWDGATMTVRVDTTVDSLLAAAEGDPAMTPELAGTIVDSFVRFRAFTGPDLADPGDDRLEMVLAIDGDEAVELRVTDGTFYVRAAVRDLVARFDPSGDGVAQLEAMLAAAPPSLDFLDEAADGRWLRIDGVEELGQMMAGMTGVPQPDPSEAAAANAAITAAVTRFIDEQVSVSFIGSDDAGEHVQLTAEGDALLDLLEQIVAAAGETAAAGLGGVDPSLLIDELRREAGPDAMRFTAPVDVWIRGDTVSRIGFDLVRLFEANAELAGGSEGLPPGVERLGLLIDVEPFDGAVDAPNDAIPVDVFGILGGLMGGFGAVPAPA